MIPIIELSRHSPGMVTALGVSMGLTASAIMARGTIAQKERWALDLLTLDKIGAWALTEPGSGSDAFGAMKSTARRDGDGYVLNGSKTFITNGPYADTIVFICKLDDGGPIEARKVVSFVIERGTPGDEVEDVVMAPHLVVRQSTAPAAPDSTSASGRRGVIGPSLASHRNGSRPGSSAVIAGLPRR